MSLSLAGLLDLILMFYIRLVGISEYNLKTWIRVYYNEFKDFVEFVSRLVRHTEFENILHFLALNCISRLTV